MNASEIGTLRAQNAVMLARGCFPENYNENLQKRLTTTEASLAQATAVTSSMAAVG